MVKLLVIDNYDSFTFNIVQMLAHYDITLEVYKNDEISISGVKKKCRIIF